VLADKDKIRIGQRSFSLGLEALDFEGEKHG
jgi:hypothetical protein